MSGGSPFAFGGAVVGGAIGALTGPMGAFKGAQVGATVGTMAGAIFNKPKDSAKGADARWGGTTYGTSISRGWGQHRTDAPVFWGVRNKDGSYLFPHTSTKRKKSGSQPVTHFRATFAFMILETGLTYCDDAQTQVERRIVVDRVWMADKIVWQSPTAVPIPAWSADATYAFGDHVTRSGQTYTSVADANQGHTPGASGTKNWWQKVSTRKNLTLYFHPDETESTFTMAASSVMVSHDGILNTPAYRGCTYGVADDIDLFDIGNTMPQNVSVEWHWADQCYFRDLLSDACGLSGMPAGSYDFSDVDALLTGYRQTARQTGGDLIGSPLSVKGYDLVSIDGVVRAMARGGPIVAAVPLSDLGATLDGQTVERLEESILADRTELHSSLRVGFFDAKAGFRQSYGTDTRNTHPVDNPTDLPTDLVMTLQEAEQAAGRILDTEHLEAGSSVAASLLGDYSALVGTDPITVPVGGRPRRFRIVGTEFVQNLQKVKLARDETEVLVRYERGSTPLEAVQDDGMIKPTAFLPLSPATDLSNDFAQYPGFYLFANGPEGWAGGQVVFTFDPPEADSREWITGPFVADQSVFGTMTSALADGGGGGMVPSSPTGLAATPGNGQVSLSWNAVGGATSYTLKRATVSGGPYTTVASGISSTSYTHTGLANGTTYWYVVSASSAAGESADSGEVSATPSTPATAPSAPASVVARGLTSRVGIDWSPSSGATSYTVKRGSSAGSYPDTIASGLSATTYTDTGRTNGTTYHYVVIASNSAGDSAPSADSSAVPIAQVTGVTATAGDKQVTLTWNDAIGATGYTVSYTASGGISGSKDVTSSSATILNLTNGTTYTFTVVGTNNLGVSDGSSPTMATPGASSNPQVPQGQNRSFAAPLQEVPAAGPPGWDVLSPSGSIVGSTATANGWNVAYSTSSGLLTVLAPVGATIATGYKARYFNTSETPVVPHAAYFDVIQGATVVDPVDQNPKSG